MTAVHETNGKALYKAYCPLAELQQPQRYLLEMHKTKRAVVSYIPHC